MKYVLKQEKNYLHSWPVFDVNIIIHYCSSKMDFNLLTEYAVYWISWIYTVHNVIVRTQRKTGSSSYSCGASVEVQGYWRKPSLFIVSIYIHDIICICCILCKILKYKIRKDRGYISRKTKLSHFLSIIHV